LPVNVAFGAERRVETYEVTAGDPASYAVGPGAATGPPRIRTASPVSARCRQANSMVTSYALYLDMEAPLTARWTVGGALRFEDFSEFGDTTDFKLSSRYAFTDAAVRASDLTGFRGRRRAARSPPTPRKASTPSRCRSSTRAAFRPTIPGSVARQPLNAEEFENAERGLRLANGLRSVRFDRRLPDRHQ
jgi:iron complex outermembrane receptor protein